MDTTRQRTASSSSATNYMVSSTPTTAHNITNEADQNGSENPYLNLENLPTEDVLRSQGHHAYAELVKKAKVHWNELQLLEAMLVTTPSLRVIQGTTLRSAKSKAEIDCCSICLDDHCDTEQYRKLPCGHVFHVQCCDEWFKSRVTCPICKGSVVNLSSDFDRAAAAETVRLNKEFMRKSGNDGKAYTNIVQPALDVSVCSPNSRRPPLRVASRTHVANV